MGFSREMSSRNLQKRHKRERIAEGRITRTKMCACHGCKVGILGIFDRDSRPVLSYLEVAFSRKFQIISEWSGEIKPGTSTIGVQM